MGVPTPQCLKTQPSTRVNPFTYTFRASENQLLSTAPQAKRSRSLVHLGGHVHGRTFTCPHLGSVYLYLRRSETGLPLPEAP